MTDEQKSASAEVTADKSAAEEQKPEEVKTEVAPTEDKKEEKKDVEVPAKFKSLVREVEKMSVLDLAELVKILEEKFGVSAAAPAIMMGAMPGAGAAEAAEEKSSFDVEITEAGSNKIAVIKAVRELTEMGLKDAKDLVDAAPKNVKEGINKEDAEVAKAKLEEAGAKVTLK